MSHSNEPTWNELPEELREAAAPARAAVLKGQSVLLVGPPGVGKTMVARRLGSVLPPLKTHSDVGAIYRMAGIPTQNLLSRPFRAPHHTCSNVGMYGDGRAFRPGEMSLAHQGVLFLDEIAEFRKEVLFSVLCVQEDKIVTFGGEPPVHLVSLPADFILVAAVNPCPCGWKGTTRKCSCSEDSVARHHARYAMLKFDVTVQMPGERK